MMIESKDFVKGAEWAYIDSASLLEAALVSIPEEYADVRTILGALASAMHEKSKNIKLLAAETGLDQ